ncbi:hypothetical protein [Rubellicoccus peritrichatus]|uniref:SprT-like domain-containing protein n=1 Tax=Rubellicoccus peritrichatus TaxID=3080537 RepID=A0AAQ3LC54_9BACT|nr:hypothetical protein [Puniceicoccus sp. CR14]WOO42627.1 hypothetical protein RZN69_05950 [Puniceicoccus sp. CR14]
MRVVDEKQNDGAKVSFYKVIQETLSMIRNHDDLRYKRVYKEISLIEHTDLPGIGAYKRGRKVCSVDLENLPALDNEEYVRVVLACTLIHEATHGKICSFFIPYTRSDRARIEGICNRESNAFLSKLDIVWAKDMRSSTDENDLKVTSSFSYKLEKLKDVAKKIMKE